jgi:hypothetical protein
MTWEMTWEMPWALHGERRRSTGTTIDAFFRLVIMSTTPPRPGLAMNIVSPMTTGRATLGKESISWMRESLAARG